MRIGGFFLVTLVAAFYAICKRNGFLLMAVFFASFCECCVVYSSSFFLSPGHFFVFLAAVAAVIRAMIGNSARFILPNKPLAVFICVALLSILVSATFRIDVQVFGVGTGHDMKSSRVSLQNFTQLLYIVVGYLFELLLVNYCVRKDAWEKVVRITVISSVFVLLIGVYQIIATRFGLPFVTIFKNAYKIQWQTQLRAQSTMGEASLLGGYCAYTAAIYFSPDYKRSKKKIASVLYIVLFCVISVMTYSSSFLFGVAVVICTYMLIEKRTQKTALKWTVIICAGAVLFIAAIQISPRVNLLINNAVNKLSLKNYSGIERLEIFEYMMRVGLKYPFLGIGFGGGRSRDLYSNLFATTGIVGVVTFFAFVFMDLRLLWKNKDVKGARMCICILAVLLINAFSNPDISYLTFWLFISIVDAKCMEILRKNRTNDLSILNSDHAEISVLRSGKPPE